MKLVTKSEPVAIVTEFEKLCNRDYEVNVVKGNKELRKIIGEIKATIEANNLISLCAKEIGYNKRVFTINFNGEYITFINPIITNAKGFQIVKETCNCRQGTWLIPRCTDINIMYQSPTGKLESKQLVGAAATVFQHNIDLLEGVLPEDFGLEIDEEFENASEDEQMEVIDYYLKTLEITKDNLDKEIQNDADLKQLSDAIDFMTDVHTGKVQVASIDYN